MNVEAFNIKISPEDVGSRRVEALRYEWEVVVVVVVVVVSGKRRRLGDQRSVVGFRPGFSWINMSGPMFTCPLLPLTVCARWERQ